MRSLALSLTLVVSLTRCSCDDALAPLPRPAATLSHANESTPPLAEITVDVGAVEIGAEVTVALVLANRGDAPLSIEAIALGTDSACAAASPDFTLAPAAAPRTLAAGADTPLMVHFRPRTGTPACTVLTIQSDDPAHPVLRARLRGQGDAAALCTDRALLDFGAVPVGRSATDRARVLSCGTRPAHVAAITANEQTAIGDVAPAPFHASTPSTPLTLAPGAALDVDLQFVPDAVRAWSVTAGAGALTFTLAEGAAYQITLVGEGVREPACEIVVAPALVEFGAVLLGRASEIDVAVQNRGTLPCHLSALALVDDATGAFSIVTDPFVAAPVLESLGATTVSLRFAPQGEGAASAALRVTSDDADTPSLDVPLEGVGVAPQPCQVIATPSAVNFGVQPTGHVAQRTITLENAGTALCLLKSLDATPAAFSVLAEAIPVIGTPMAPGASFDVGVTFSPGLDAASGALNVVSKAVGASAPLVELEVPLWGTGTAPCIRVAPLDVDFGAVAVGATRDESVAIENCGAADLVVRGVMRAPGTDVALSIAQSPSLPFTLAPGSATAAVVRAAPAAAGPVRGALDVLSDDPLTPSVRVELRANASLCPTALRCAPSPLVFGETRAGETRVRPLACSNAGAAPIAIDPSVAAPFFIDEAPAAVPAGGTAIVRIGYAPTTEGAHAASVEIAAALCDGATVDVEGTAVDDPSPPCPTVTPAPVLSWRYADGDVLTTPLVARLHDTDEDGHITRADTPRVVVIVVDPALAPAGGTNDAIAGRVVLLDGATGAVALTMSEPLVRASVTPAVVDLDGDGFMELIATLHEPAGPGVADVPGGEPWYGRYTRGHLVAFDRLGALLWVSDEWTRPAWELEDGGGIAVADVDGDGDAEIGLGDHLFDHHGHLLWVGGRAIGSAGRGATVTFGDLDGAPGLELVAGRTAYRADGSVLWDREDLAAFGEDGLPAVGDLDGDGRNEVVMRSASVWVLDGQTGETVAGPLLPPIAASPGRECDANDLVYPETCYPIPANVALAPLDDEPGLDLAVANHDLLLTYRFDRDGPWDLVEMWRATAQDPTGASGPASFDFFGDGTHDVVYADEGWVCGYRDGGALWFEEERSSITVTETAAVADVDGDGAADLVVTENDLFGGQGRGVTVWHGAPAWPRAPAMWNQHAFIDDQIDELGAPLTTSSISGFRAARGTCE